MNLTNKTTIGRVFLALVMAVSISALIFASEPVIWELNSRAELLKGEARGVSITDTGAIMLAPKFTQVFNTEQAYVWSTAIDPAGNVFLGTGHDGRIFRVAADGKGALFHDTAELDVTALAVAKDGSLFAGTSPDGKVYRITIDGRADVYFDPADKYIWALATMPDGSLAVATGDNGKLYRVREANAKPELSVFLDTQETHIISLAIDSKGQLIAGTDPGGLVLRISNEGKAFGLFDAPLREIHSLAMASDDSVYALALSEAAATTRSVGAPPSPIQTEAGGQPSTSVTITAIDESGAPIQTSSSGSTRSRNDLSNARSAVFRILPDGGTDVIWNSPSITAFAVAVSPHGSVLVGTSDKGRVYSVSNDGRDTLLVQSSEGQLSSFAVRGREVFAASSNQGKLFRIESDLVADGTYESPVRDAKIVATWGRVWWRGQGSVEVQTRSGNSERPDSTWSEWSAAYSNPAGAAITSPRARFIQWRAKLANNATTRSSARIDGLSIAYQPRNVAPEVLGISVLPAGVGLQQAMLMPIDPNVEQSGLDPAMFGAVGQVPPRKVYQRGARSLQWQAEDRNGDAMEYAIYYRSVSETSFHLLKDKLKDNYFTIDGATLPDGRYVFKVVVSDSPDNAAGQALTGERATEPVELDNSPPMIRAVGEPVAHGDRVKVAFDVEDATGMIRRADFSVNGSVWRPVVPDDGIADSPRERFTIELPIAGAGEHVVSLRVFDTSGNIGSIRLPVRR